MNFFRDFDLQIARRNPKLVTDGQEPFGKRRLPQSAERKVDGYRENLSSLILPRLKFGAHESENVEIDQADRIEFLQQRKKFVGSNQDARLRCVADKRLTAYNQAVFRRNLRLKINKKMVFSELPF